MDLKDVKKQLIDEDVEQLLEYSELLEPITRDSYIPIDKETFELYFLPFIIGSIERSEDNYLIYTSNYLRLTKNSYYKRIYVVKDDDTILYKLPSLIINTDINKLKKINFNHLINALSGDIDNRHVEGYISLTSKAVDENLTPDEKTLQEQIYDLNKIFKDYGKYGDEVIKKQYGNVKSEEEVEDDIDDFLD